LGIEEMQTLARQRGGLCLSTEYAKSYTKLEWKCIRGHNWMATPAAVKHRGSWCPVCARGAPLGLENMQALARKRGGFCLSIDYVNSYTKLEWQCSQGHTWKATPSSVKYRGHWCPFCAMSRSDGRARRLGLINTDSQPIREAFQSLATDSS